MEKILQQKNRTRPKVGVVIGSGGMKTLASIALYEFFYEENIDVDLLVGCSGGSGVAALWAMGDTPEKMREKAYKYWGNRAMLSRTDYKTLLSIAGLPFGRFNKNSGLLKPDLVFKAYNTLYGDRKIEDLDIPLRIQTTNLLNGQPVVLDKGSIADAVYASGALFPLLPSKEIDGQNLIDGVYSAPLPVMEAVNSNMDVVIAITYEERTNEESRNFLSYFLRSVGYSQQWLQRNQLALSVDLHHHEIVFINVVFDRYISLRSTRRIPEILEKGTQAVQEKKEEILAAINHFSPISM